MIFFMNLQSASSKVRLQGLVALQVEEFFLSLLALRRQVFIFACWKRNIKLQVLHKKLDAKILGADHLVRV